jgi:hypothetical protein
VTCHCQLEPDHGVMSAIIIDGRVRQVRRGRSWGLDFQAPSSSEALTVMVGGATMMMMSDPGEQIEAEEMMVLSSESLFLRS